MAVLNDLMVKGKTRLIGDVNAGNIKSSVLNTGIVSASTVSSTSSASTSYAENGVLLSNKYAAKSHTHTLSQVYSDAIAQGTSVVTNDTLLICPRNTSTGVIKQPDALKFDTTDTTKFLCHNGTFAVPTASTTNVCSTTIDISASQTSATNVTVNNGTPVVGGIIVGGNGGIGSITSATLVLSNIYSMTWTYKGSVFRKDLCVITNTTHSATWNYQKTGQIVTMWGPTSSFMMDSNMVFTGLPYAPAATTFVNVPIWLDGGSVDGYVTVVIYTENNTTKMAVKALRYNSSGTLLQSTTYGTVMYYFGGYASNQPITYIASA